MRRFLTAVAGAAIASAVVASGASALQVLPSSDPAATGTWPGRPYLASSEIVTRGASGSIVVHGSCFGALSSDPSKPTLDNGTLLGEYPYGGEDQPGNGVVASVPGWATPGPDYALEYKSGVVVVGSTPADNNMKATLHPADSNGSPAVTYSGNVEYLLYSDSYSTGPIDLDVAPVNGNGSYDIRLNTAGLGVDTYTIRFLGCRELSASWASVTRVWNINYYQGTPNSASIFTNYNSSSNSPGGTSYVPTNIRAANDPAFPGTAGQIAVGYDSYRCVYSSGSDNDNPSVHEGARNVTVSGSPGVSGRGPNEYGQPNGSWSTPDNFTCPDYSFTIPAEVLPLTSGYNGNTDFSCLNAYNNAQPYGGQIGQNPYPGNGTTSYCPSGYDPVGIRANSIYDFYARFQVVAPAAASPSAAPAPAAAPAFVAPVSAPAAAAAQSATVAVIQAAGGTATASPVVVSTPTQAAGTPSQAVAAPVAQAAPAAQSAPAAQVAATPAGVTAKASAVQARVLAPAKSVTASKVAPKATAKVVTKAATAKKVVTTVKKTTTAKKVTVKK